MAGRRVMIEAPQSRSSKGGGNGKNGPTVKFQTEVCVISHLAIGPQDPDFCRVKAGPVLFRYLLERVGCDLFRVGIDVPRGINSAADLQLILAQAASAVSASKNADKKIAVIQRWQTFIGK